MWIHDPSFEDVIQDSWGCRAENLGAKLGKVGEDLSLWNKRVFGNIYAKKKRITARLIGIQNYVQYNPNSRFHLDLEETLQNELLDTLLHEEWLWLAKSRVEWLTQGDRNTAFFHRSVLSMRQQSAIRCLKDVCGNEVTDQEELGKLIQRF